MLSFLRSNVGCSWLFWNQFSPLRKSLCSAKRAFSHYSCFARETVVHLSCQLAWLKSIFFFPMTLWKCASARKLGLQSTKKTLSMKIILSTYLDESFCFQMTGNNDLTKSNLVAAATEDSTLTCVFGMCFDVVDFLKSFSSLQPEFVRSSVRPSCLIWQLDSYRNQRDVAPATATAAHWVFDDNFRQHSLKETRYRREKTDLDRQMLAFIKYERQPQPKWIWIRAFCTFAGCFWWWLWLEQNSLASTKDVSD